MAGTINFAAVSGWQGRNAYSQKLAKGFGLFFFFFILHQIIVTTTRQIEFKKNKKHKLIKIKRAGRFFINK